MTDRLEQALRALREGETGENPKSAETLERVLASRRGASGVWTRRARLWLPIAAVLVVATSALARSGAMGTVRGLFEGKEASERASDAPMVVPPVALLPHESAPREEASVAVVETPPAVPASPPPAIALHPRVAPAPPPRAIPVPSATPNPPPAPVEESGPSETDVYTRAHRLHFGGGDAAGALAAWDEYLRLYPAGRFAPDARFNRAIDLLETKRTAEARAALQPFADGVYGDYHRDDARELLRAVP